MIKTKITNPVNLPKKLVAKLLATENIDVVSEKIPTAYFDLKARKIGIPIWENVSQNVYDLMVGHEVGHALYTPIKVLEEARERKIPKSFVNVIEDIRIEKMIQNKYPGLVTNFTKGYKELVKRNFFDLRKKSKPLLELGLVDRLNIYAKTKNENIVFLDEEQWVFADIEKMTTWLDAVNLAEKLAKYMEDNPESQGESVKMSDELMDSGDSETGDCETGGSGDSDSGDSGDSDSGDSGDSDSGDSDSGDSDSGDSDSEDSKTGKTNDDEDDWETDYTSESITDKNLEKKLKDSADTTGEYLNVKMPDYDLKEVIVNYDVIAKLDDDFIKKDVELRKNRQNTSYNPHKSFDYLNSVISADFKKFKDASMKTVNYFVKEFEMKKSADNYARATVSKQGSLNLKVLHKYKFEDDLFLKVTNIPDGKSHGFIFYLDWSASMDDNLVPTMKQLLNLVWFAKKTNIPFEVYAFSDGFYSQIDGEKRKESIFSSEIGDTHLGTRFHLLELCNSKMNNSKLNEALKRFYGLTKRMCWWNLEMNSSSEEQSVYSQMDVPQELKLSGTPLLQTAYVNVELTERFLKTYGVDKLNVCYLTDGMGSPLRNYVVGHDTLSDGKKVATKALIPTARNFPEFSSAESEFHYNDMSKAPNHIKYNKSNTRIKVGKYNHFDIPPAHQTTENKSSLLDNQIARGDSQYADLFEYEFEQFSKIAKQNTNCNILGFHLISTSKSGKVKTNEVGYAIRSHESLLKNQLKKDKHYNSPSEETPHNYDYNHHSSNDYISKKINKDGVYNIPGVLGMDDYFLMPGGKGIDLDDTELSKDLVGANKRQLIKAFGKNRNDKLKKRVLCNKFIDRIC